MDGWPAKAWQQSSKAITSDWLVVGVKYNIIINILFFTKGFAVLCFHNFGNHFPHLWILPDPSSIIETDWSFSFPLCYLIWCIHHVLWTPVIIWRRERKLRLTAVSKFEIRFEACGFFYLMQAGLAHRWHLRIHSIFWMTRRFHRLFVLFLDNNNRFFFFRSSVRRSHGMYKEICVRVVSQ